MKLSPAGVALIQSFEKCRLHAYLPTPNDVPTIGWGSTEDVRMGDVWTQEQADERFMRDIEWAEDCVNKAVTAQLRQNEFDACVSLCFNIGCAAFGKSTLARMLNAGDYDGAAAQFARWDKQKGQVLAGLTRRRAAEAALFEEV